MRVRGKRDATILILLKEEEEEAVSDCLQQKESVCVYV